MSLCIINLLITALDVPFSPWSNDSHFRCKSLNSKLESYLVVALTCTAVANCISTLFKCNLSDAFCNYRTSKGSTEHISIFVYSSCLNCRINVVLDEFFLKICNNELGSTSLDSLLLKSVKLCALSYVTRNSDNFAVVVVFLEPRNNDGCVKSARICEDYLFDILFVSHCNYLLNIIAALRTARICNITLLYYIVKYCQVFLNKYSLFFVLFAFI